MFSTWLKSCRSGGSGGLGEVRCLRQQTEKAPGEASLPNAFTWRALSRTSSLSSSPFDVSMVTDNR